MIPEAVALGLVAEAFLRMSGDDPRNIPYAVGQGDFSPHERG